MAGARAVATAMTGVAGTTLLVVLLAAGTASAQSSSPTTSGCTSVLVSLSPCLKYITGNESAPTAPCCAQLGKAVRSDPKCLCAALGADPASLGLSVNRTRALGLPDQCKVQTPPVSDCKQGSAPTGGEATPTTTPASGSKGTTPPSTAFANGASPRPGSMTTGFVVAAAAAAAVFLATAAAV